MIGEFSHTRTREKNLSDTFSPLEKAIIVPTMGRTSGYHFNDRTEFTVSTGSRKSLSDGTSLVREEEIPALLHYPGYNILEIKIGVGMGDLHLCEEKD